MDAADTVMVPLLEPEEGDTVSHEAEPLLTVQLVLEVTEKVFCSLEDEKLSEDGDTDKLGASCVTLIVRVIPPPLTVMFAVRCEVVAVAVTVIVPLFEPEAGETVSQDEALLLTLQLILDEIVNCFCSPELEKLNEFNETDKLEGKGCCITLSVFPVTPSTLLLTVIVAVRESVFVFGLAITLTVRLFEPYDGDTVSHEASFETVH